MHKHRHDNISNLKRVGMFIMEHLKALKKIWQENHENMVKFNKKSFGENLVIMWYINFNWQ